jgi:hypothetical protein
MKNKFQKEKRSVIMPGKDIIASYAQEFRRSL